jgi:hypothetical protein
VFRKLKTAKRHEGKWVPDTDIWINFDQSLTMSPGYLLMEKLNLSKIKDLINSLRVR